MFFSCSFSCPFSCPGTFSCPDGASDFNYDNVNQVTSADHSSQSDENYVYDENGNRTSSGYQTGPYNRMLSDGSFDYEYDAEGNRTKRTEIATGAVTDYEWDHRNRLLRVTDRSIEQGAVTGEVVHTYDVFDRWISREVDADGDGPQSSETMRFFYDGSQIVLQTDTTGIVAHRYLWGPSVDQVLADEDANGDILWPLTNHQGTVDDLIDSSGTVVNHRVFDSYGNIASETDAAIDHLFGYTGRPFDESTGLQNNLNRWYDADVGRWLNEDVIGFAGRDENLYRYVGNRTTDRIDPNGLESAPPGYMLVRNPFSPSGEMMLVRDPNFELVRNPFSPTGASFAIPTKLSGSKERSGDCDCESTLRNVPEVDALLHAIERLELDLYKARMAEDVYNDTPGTIGGGWQRNGTIGETAPFALRNGFRAAHYSNSDTNKHVISFAGTTPTSAADWAANLLQGIGMWNDQYESAIAIAQSARKMHGAGNVHIVGHSLGGGLASASSLVTGTPATVFNPAGPHPYTIAYHNPDAAARYNTYGGDHLVRTYRVPGEVLTGLDRLPLIGQLLPDYAGTTYETESALP
jgi:RHS repeat-associated protein